MACCDIQQDAGSAAAAELGGNAAFFQLDVSNYEEQAKVFSQVWEKWGRLDALLANAGHSDRSSIYIFDHRGKKEIPPKPALLSIKACYESLLYGVQLAIHFMRQNVVPGGQIIATSTIASVHPHQTFPEYCGAKAAVCDNSYTHISIILEVLLTGAQQINQFVRTAAPILKLVRQSPRQLLRKTLTNFSQKENITLNAVLPGIVITGAVPQASVDATKPEQ